MSLKIQDGKMAKCQLCRNNEATFMGVCQICFDKTLEFVKKNQMEAKANE